MESSLINEKVKLLAAELGELRIKQDVPLTNGKAAILYIATNQRELKKAVVLALELDIPYLISGLSTKIALSESGFMGLVIKNRSDNIRIFGLKGKVSRSGLGVEEASIETDSGVSIEKLTSYAKASKLSGVERLSGSPGTVGGNYFYHPHMINLAHQVKVLVGDQEEIRQPQQVKKDEVILSVVFKLRAR